MGRHHRLVGWPGSGGVTPLMFGIVASFRSISFVFFVTMQQTKNTAACPCAR